jgi:hypothetical protein
MMQEKGTARFVEAFAVPLRMAPRGRVCCVRLWKVDVVSLELELLPLRALLCGLLVALLCSFLRRLLCVLLSTFFSCHELLLLLFSL